MINVKQTGNFTESYRQGNVTVRFFNDGYAGKTTEDLRKTLVELTKVCRQCLEAAGTDTEKIKHYSNR